MSNQNSFPQNHPDPSREPERLSPEGDRTNDTSLDETVDSRVPPPSSSLDKTIGVEAEKEGEANSPGGLDETLDSDKGSTPSLDKTIAPGEEALSPDIEETWDSPCRSKPELDKTEDMETPVVNEKKMGEDSGKSEFLASCPSTQPENEMKVTPEDMATEDIAPGEQPPVVEEMATEDMPSPPRDRPTPEGFSAGPSRGRRIGPPSPEGWTPLGKDLSPLDTEGLSQDLEIPVDQTEETPLDFQAFERANAFVYLLWTGQLLSEERIREVLGKLNLFGLAGDKFKVDQAFLKEKVVSFQQYLQIQERLNQSTAACSSCQQTTYNLEEENVATPCARCIHMGRINSSGGAHYISKRVEVVETFFSHKKSGLEGRIINGYEIIGEIARGGMGIVYKARQVDLNRTVAFKVIREAQTAQQYKLQRFLREARAMASLNHPNIVKIYDIGQFDNQYYFTMDFVVGRPLSELIADRELTVPRSAKIARDIAYAVDYAHSKGIIHRDLKPANVMIDSDGNPIVMDFGLAKNLEDSTEESLTMTGAVIGTPLYLAPEQISSNFGPVDRQTDLYAIGVILYEMLAGKVPFLKKTKDLLYQSILKDDLPDLRRFNPLVPVDLDTICRKVLEKEKDRRYSSNREFALDIERFLNGEPISARRPTQLERLGRKARKNPGVVALIATLILVAGWWSYTKYTEPGILEIPSLHGGRLWIDDKEVEVDQREERILLSLKVGTRTLEFRKAGYYSVVKKVTLSRGKTTYFKPILNRRMGYLTLTARPRNALVTLVGEDGKERKVTTPLIRHPLPTGRYRYVISRPNYFSRQGEVTIEDRENTRRFSSLSPVLKWKMTVDSPGAMILSASDLNGDGYPDFAIREHREIHLWDGFSRRRLYPLREFISPERKRGDKTINKHNRHVYIGEIVNIQATNRLENKKLYVTRVEGREYLLVLGKSGKIYDHQGRHFKSLDLSASAFQERDRLYYYGVRPSTYFRIVDGQRVIDGKYQFYCRSWGENLESQFRMFIDRHWSFDLPRKKLLRPRPPTNRPKHPVFLRGPDFLVALEKKDGTFLWSHPLRSKSPYSPDQREDFDGDGIPDPVLEDKGKLLVFSGARGSILKTWQGNLSPQSRLVVTDLDGDGKGEIVGFNQDQKLTAWKEGGEILWTWADHTANSPRCLNEYDIDGDGVLDFVFLSQNKLVALSGKRGTPLLTFDCPHTLIGVPLLLDVDRDGQLDGLFSSSAGDVYCVHLSFDAKMWYRRLPANLRYGGRLGEDVAEFFGGGQVWRYSLKQGKLLEKIELWKNDERVLFAGGRKNRRRYLSYHPRGWKMADDKGNVLWERKNWGVKPEEVLAINFVQKGVCRLEVRVEGHSQKKVALLYLLPRKKEGRDRDLLLIYPDKTLEKVRVERIDSATGKRKWKYSLEGNKVLRILSICLPQVVSFSNHHRLVMATGETYLLSLRLDKPDLKYIRLNSSAVGLYAQDIRVIPRGEEVHRLFYRNSVALTGFEMSTKKSWYRPLRYFHKWKASTVAGKYWKHQELLVTRTKNGSDQIVFYFFDLEKNTSYVLALDGNTGDFNWTLQPPDKVFRPLQKIDLEGDGEDEIVLSTSKHLEILEGTTGRLLWSISLENPELLEVLRPRGDKNPSLLIRSGVSLYLCPVQVASPPVSDQSVHLPDLQNREGQTVTEEGKRRRNLEYTTEKFRYYYKLCKTRNPNMLLPLLNKLIHKFPSSLSFGLARSDLLLQMDRPKMSLVQLGKLRRLYPDSPYILRMLAHTHYKLKNYYKAYFFIESALRARSQRPNLEWSLVNDNRHLRIEILKKITEVEKARKERKKKRRDLDEKDSKDVEKTRDYLKKGERLLLQNQLKGAKKNLKWAQFYFRAYLRQGRVDSRIEKELSQGINSLYTKIRQRERKSFKKVAPARVSPTRLLLKGQSHLRGFWWAVERGEKKRAVEYLNKVRKIQAEYNNLANKNKSSSLAKSFFEKLEKVEKTWKEIGKSPEKWLRYRQEVKAKKYLNYAKSLFRTIDFYIRKKKIQRARQRLGIAKSYYTRSVQGHHPKELAEKVRTRLDEFEKRCRRLEGKKNENSEKYSDSRITFHRAKTAAIKGHLQLAVGRKKRAYQYWKQSLALYKKGMAMAHRKEEAREIKKKIDLLGLSFEKKKSGDSQDKTKGDPSDKSLPPAKKIKEPSTLSGTGYLRRAYDYSSKARSALAHAGLEKVKSYLDRGLADYERSGQDGKTDFAKQVEEHLEKTRDMYARKFMIKASYRGRTLLAALRNAPRPDHLARARAFFKQWKSLFPPGDQSKWPGLFRANYTVYKILKRQLDQLAKQVKDQ